MASQISGLGIWEYSADERTLFFSDEWFSLRGYAPNSPHCLLKPFDTWISRVHPDDAAHVAHATAQFHKGIKDDINFEYREQHADGHYIWVLSRGKIVEWHADGTPYRFLGTDTDITSTKTAQSNNKELLKTQLRYGTAIQTADVGVWDADFVTGDRYRSDGWKMMRGHAPDSSYGVNSNAWRQDVHPEDIDMVERQVQKFFSNEVHGTISTEYRQQRKDGSWMWILSRGNVVARAPDGSALRAIGVDTEITDIKEKEAILQRVSKTLELAISASNMGVWESFSESGDAIWDARTREIFGMGAGSAPVPPDEFKSFIHPDDIVIVEEECDAPASQGRDFESSFRIIHPEKGIRHVNVQATFHPTHELGPRHVGIISDVTERVEREAAIHQSNDLLADVLQQMEQGIVMFQGDDLQSSHVVLSNEKFFELLEMDPTQVEQPLSFDAYSQHIDPFVHWPQNGFNSLAEVVAAAQDGAAMNTLLRLPSGRVISVTGIGHGSDCRIVTYTDMTDLFKSERHRAELADSIHHLEKLQAIGKLTGGVAHDFNNLLAVIIGNAELILEAQDFEPDYLNAIRVAAKRGADLTQRLLAFSRKQPLQPVSIAPDRLLSNLEGLLARTLGDTIQIDTRIAPETWNVHADLGQLENALINLAVNARDAMPNGGKLCITAQNETVGNRSVWRFDQLTPGQYIKFTVSDQGVGMDAGVLENAFDPFFTTKDVGQGSGLGLSMVYGFVKQSKGDIKISSHVGHGTTVEFLLPHCDTHVRDVPKTKTDAAQDGAQQTIALVEDDPSVRRMIEATLKRLNYRVVSFEDAVQALDALSGSGFEPDLVISDVSLPGGISGFDLGEKLTSLNPDSKILYMSGYSEDLLPAHRLDMETLEFIRKPFSVHEFSARISTIFEGKSWAREDH